MALRNIPGELFSVLIHIGCTVVKASTNGAAYGRFSVYQATCEWVSLLAGIVVWLDGKPPGVSTLAYRVCGVMMAHLNGSSLFQ